MHNVGWHALSSLSVRASRESGCMHCARTCLLSDSTPAMARRSSVEGQHQVPGRRGAPLGQVLPELAAAARDALEELADGFPLKERLDMSENRKLQRFSRIVDGMANEAARKRSRILQRMQSRRVRREYSRSEVSPAPSLCSAAALHAWDEHTNAKCTTPSLCSVAALHAWDEHIDANSMR